MKCIHLLFAGFFFKTFNRSHNNLIIRNKLIEIDYDSSLEISENGAVGVQKSYFEKSGLDGRYDRKRNVTLDNEIISNITQYMKKMEIMKMLQSNDLSVFHKLEILEKYNIIIDEKYGLNLASGGLFNDYEFEL
jgi:hypothetical protein